MSEKNKHFKLNDYRVPVKAVYDVGTEPSLPVHTAPDMVIIKFGGPEGDDWTVIHLEGDDWTVIHLEDK